MVLVVEMEEKQAMSSHSSPSKNVPPVLPSSSRAGASGDPQTDVEDFRALQDACLYVKTVVANFQSRADSLDSRARETVEELNNDLRRILFVGKDSQSMPSCDVFPGVKPKKKVIISDRVASSSGTDTGDGESCSVDSDTRDHAARLSDVGSARREFAGMVSHAPMSLDELASVLSRLDNRSVIKPEKYDLTSGQLLGDFLSVFEEYCINNFKGSKTLWIAELGRFLTGTIYDAYLVLKTPGDSYSALKKKLLKWCRDSQDSIRRDTLKQFERARINPNEPVRLYAARLERAFTMAYPRKHVRSSTTLRKKFLDSVPKGFRKTISTAESVLAVQHVKLTWDSLLTLASQYDAKRDNTDTASEREADVWVSTVPLAHQSVPRTYSSNRASTVVQDTARQTSLSPKRSSKRDSTFSSRTCFHCQKKGHVKAECRRFNGLCLVCGSREHRIAACPMRRTVDTAALTNQSESNGKPKVTFNESAELPLNLRSPSRKGTLRRS